MSKEEFYTTGKKDSFKSFAEFSGGAHILNEKQISNISNMPMVKSATFQSFCD